MALKEKDLFSAKKAQHKHTFWFVFGALSFAQSAAGMTTSTTKSPVFLTVSLTLSLISL